MKKSTKTVVRGAQWIAKIRMCSIQYVNKSSFILFINKNNHKSKTALPNQKKLACRILFSNLFNRFLSLFYFLKYLKQVTINFNVTACLLQCICNQVYQSMVLYTKDYCRFSSLRRDTNNYCIFGS